MYRKTNRRTIIKMVILREAAVKTRFSIIALAAAAVTAASQHAYYGFMVLPLLVIIHSKLTRS